MRAFVIYFKLLCLTRVTEENKVNLSVFKLSAVQDL